MTKKKINTKEEMWHHLPIETTTYAENKAKTKESKKLIKAFLKHTPSAKTKS